MRSSLELKLRVIIIGSFILALLYLALLIFLIIPLQKEKDITTIQCDAFTSCPKGLECFSFPKEGTVCAKPDPCSYYCSLGRDCLILESYPAQIKCENSVIRAFN